MNTLVRTLNHWRTGVRLYIGITVAAITLEVWWWTHSAYAGTPLYATRMEEIFAWLSLGMITTAVFIGPSYKFFPRLPGRRIMFDARRLLGVGGAWFASLHVAISYASLFQFANPLSLPTKYQQAFALGTVALLVLLAMAFTSFDRAFHRLGIWWFRIHRFVYLALLAILAHAFLIGVHATKPTVVLILIFLSAALVLFHALGQRGKAFSVWRVATLSGSTLALILIFIYGFTHQPAVSPAAPSTEGNYAQ